PPVAVDAGTDTAPAPTPALPGAGRPEVVEGVITLEGMREPMTYRLYRSPPGFPLPFSTYLPADMEADEVGSGDGDAVRFVAVLGGGRIEEMCVSVYVPPAPLTTEEARARARGIAASRGRVEPGEAGVYPWALEWHRYEGEGSLVGTVALGRHADRYFFVLTRYPAEAGDGFGPRARRVLDEWRWAEGGGLGS